MPYSLRPKYVQIGSTGKYEQYKMTERENINLPFRFDTLDEEEVEREMAELESHLGITEEVGVDVV